MRKLLFVFGTRPEAIKMAPVIIELKKLHEYFDIKVCITAQHRQMLDQVLKFFSIEPDFDLDLMVLGQSLFDFTAKAIKALEEVLTFYLPDLLLVQGDTTSAMVAALAAYYKKIKVAHIEAGLRSGNIYSPFPEEINRKIIGYIAHYHFAPTENAKENLLREGISRNVYVVGNTVIDALFTSIRILAKEEVSYKEAFSYLDFSKKIILVTAHRRESFGNPFEEMCLALKDIAVTHNDVCIVYPVHLNPNVQEPVRRILGECKRIYLIDPLDYPSLIWLMNKSYIVLTDSGGIQEEAPSLGKPVLVMRDVTERQEGIDAGTAILVGTSRKKIVAEANHLLNDFDAYQHMATASNPYGDGTASKQIAHILTSEYFDLRKG